MKNLAKFDRCFGIKTILVVLALSLATTLSFPTASAFQNPQLSAKPTRLAKAIQDLQQSKQRWIQIDLLHQRLIAWEGQTPIYAVLISTGKSSTPTPTGVFSIQTRYRYAHMQGVDYDVPNVPYTMYYYGGYAIHGAYWHRRFGTPVSHGCINVAVNHARWLFYWAKVGTPVVVHR
jgi:lipoprotein-anchoring transpeptidase ErfK/SrfK